MRILGIETSCDETGIAIYDGHLGLLADALHSQVAVHAEFGGVVPELASRDHIRRLTPLVEQVLQQSHSKPEDIDAIAYTAGPGLVGALFTGAAFGKSLAFAWGIPAIPIHHMEGHLLAPMLEENAPEFPFIALLVSGGHTLLAEVQKMGDYIILGQSLDDAAGEAFDKTAKLLGLGYPGGPELAKTALRGTAGRFKFPRPMTDRPGLDFSFSGLKTFTRNTIEAHEPLDAQTQADIALAFEEAVAQTLVIKCQRAMQQTGLERLVVAGGVSANQRIRQQLQVLAKKKGFEVFYPRQEFCTDNGAMIAFAGYLRLQNTTPTQNLSFQVRARWPINQIND